MKNILCGFADEAGHGLETQIRVTLELGWRDIEMRNVQVGDYPSANLHDIPDEAFLQVVDRLGEAGVRVYCFGSAIANGACDIRKPFDETWAQAQRAAVRMPKLGTKFMRIMSYPVLKDQDDQMEAERFRRLREIQQLFQDSGVTLVHENCSNYGGMGWPFTLKLVENVPGLKLAFDTGNCAHNLDYSKPEPRPWQSALEFYQHVREHIVHVHIKDFVRNPDLHVFAGEGAGEVRPVVTDLLATGYTGAFSIEPHMKVAPMFQNAPDEAEGRYLTYVEYGRRFMKLLAASQP